MNNNQSAGSVIGRLIQHICRLPKTLAAANKQRQWQVACNAREAERIDRICHPSKYRGK